MIKDISDRVRLANGVQMPWLGLGVFPLKNGPETENAVLAALQAGYRSIDTASIYQNETSVGRAIAMSGIQRQEIFVTSKVWNSDQGYQTTLKAYEASRKRLKVAQIDLYLIHWPVKGRYLETWKALEKLYQEGQVRAIGVSNFQIHHLKELFAICEERPVVNQVEFHPYLRQPELHQYCRDNQIQLEAWSPLGQGLALTNPNIIEIARSYEKKPAQIILRWELQHQVVTIPKSGRMERIIENSQVFDFHISTEDMARIDQLDEHRRIGDDPDNFNF